MAIICLTSASGSPGVTTTALGLALAWPRPVVLVEADPTGGSGILAGYFKGNTAHTGGLIELAKAQREGQVAEELPHQLVELPDSQATFLPGSRSHAQAGSLLALWPDLLEALRDLEVTGQDVLVDAGRLGLEGCPRPLLSGADLTLLLTRSTLPALIAATSWADTLREESSASPTRVGVVVIGEGQPYSAREVSDALGLPMIAGLAWDRRSAAVLSRARGTFPRRGRLRASLSAAGESIRSAAQSDARTPASPLAWITRAARSTVGGLR